jgi:hypothetical protein
MTGITINGTNYVRKDYAFINDGVTPSLLRIVFSKGDNDNYVLNRFGEQAIEFEANWTSTRQEYELLCDDLGISYDNIPSEIQ